MNQPRWSQEPLPILPDGDLKIPRMLLLSLVKSGLPAAPMSVALWLIATAYSKPLSRWVPAPRAELAELIGMSMVAVDKAVSLLKTKQIVQTRTWNRYLWLRFRPEALIEQPADTDSTET